MNVLFIGRLKHAGLALAIGLGACLNAALLYRVLRRAGTYVPQPEWPLFLLKVLAAVALMGVVLFSAIGKAAWWLAAGWEKKIPAVLGLVLLEARLTVPPSLRLASGPGTLRTALQPERAAAVATT